MQIQDPEVPEVVVMEHIISKMVPMQPIMAEEAEVPVEVLSQENQQ